MSFLFPRNEILNFEMNYLLLRNVFSVVHKLINIEKSDCIN